MDKTELEVALERAEKAEARVKELEGDKKGLVLQNAMLRQRPDLPVDRIPAFKEMSDKIKELEGGIRARNASLTFSEDEITRLKAENESLKRELEFVPGHSECPRCSFYCVQSILHPNGISPDKRIPDQCPNDGTEMMPVTWFKHTRNMQIGQEEILARAIKAEEKIASLTAENESLRKDHDLWKASESACNIQFNKLLEEKNTIEARLTEALGALKELKQEYEKNEHEYRWSLTRINAILSTPDNTRLLEREKERDMAIARLSEAEKENARLRKALDIIASDEVIFPDYDWSDWNGNEAQVEARNLIAQFAKLSLIKPQPDKKERDA